MERERQDADHHPFVGFRRVARDREHMIVVVIAVHVGDLKRRLADCCLERHARIMPYGVRARMTVRATKRPDAHASGLFPCSANALNQAVYRLLLRRAINPNNPSPASNIPYVCGYGIAVANVALPPPPLIERRVVPPPGSNGVTTEFVLVKAAVKSSCVKALGLTKKPSNV